MSEMYPPEGDQSLGPRPPETGELIEPGIPWPGKQKLRWGFALLGFVVVGVVSWGLVAAASALLGLTEEWSNLIAPIALVLEVVLFAGMVVAWVEGRRRGINRLRSFGIGGLATYLAAALLSMLAVGACFVSLGTGGGLFGN